MAYSRVNWENTPSHVTPLDADNLNQMDEAIANIDEELGRVGTKAVNLEARTGAIEDELEELDPYAKSMGAKTLVHDTAISTLQGQVTQIISGGSSSGDEVADIRVAENGTTYETAGDAVRAQIGQFLEIASEEPTDPGNKLWIDDETYSSGTQVPTYEEFIQRTGFVVHNLIDTNNFYENYRTDLSAMSSDGVVTRTASTSVVTNQLISLKPGTYYVRVPYTSTGSIIIWKKGTYPVTPTSVSMSSIGITRTMTDGTAIFEYTLVLTEESYIAINCQIASGNYKTIVLISTVNFLGSDMVVNYGKYGFINTVPKDLETLNTEINALNGITFSGQKITNITGTTTSGKCYNNTSGAGSTSFANASATEPYIIIEAGASYKFTGRVISFAGGVCFYNANKVFISGQFGTDGSTVDYTDAAVVIPEGAVYLNASTQNNNNKALVLKKLVNTPDLRTFCEENQGDINGLKEYTVKVNHIYVATTGNDSTGDGSAENPFATIFHANETIIDNAEHNRYIIHVADGTYTDLQTKYSGSTPTGVEGVYCKDYVYYEGNISNPSACILKWDGATGYTDGTYTYEDYGFYKCIFHVGSETHTSIRGFKLNATNTRYCLHIEMAGYGKGAEWEVSDCIFLWNGTPDCTDREYSTPVIGTGSGNFEKGHLLRCKIDNQSDSAIGWMNHDSPNRYANVAFSEGPEIIIEACDFDGTNICFRNIYGDSTVDGYDRFSIIDCINVNKLYYALGGESTVCQWRALVKCSDITDNVFETEDLLQ